MAPRSAARYLAALSVVMVIVTSCSPDPIEVEVEPERAQSCDDLIPTGEALAVQLLAAVESVPLDVLTGDEPATGDLADLLAKGREYDTRSRILECDPEALNLAIMERVGDDLDPSSLAGVLLLEIMQGGAGNAPPDRASPDRTTSAPDDE